MQFQAGLWVQLPDLIFPDKQIIYFMGNPMSFRCWKLFPTNKPEKRHPRSRYLWHLLCFEWSGSEPFFFFWRGGGHITLWESSENKQVLRKVVLNIHLKMVLPTNFQRLSMVPGLPEWQSHTHTANPYTAFLHAHWWRTPPTNAGDTGLIPGLGKSPVESGKERRYLSAEWNMMNYKF